MKIATFIGYQALGDCIMAHVVAASVAQASGGRLAILQRADRPYKNFMAQLNPYVDLVLTLPEGRPLEMENLFGLTPRAPHPGWVRLGYHEPDMVLTASALEIESALPPYPALRIPEDQEAPLASMLEKAGITREGWFACLHVRELSYGFRENMDEMRCADPNTYNAAIDTIIASGGQVVRLGDASMTPLPARNGLIDLRDHVGGFPLQAFASARARFFMGTDSGPTQVAAAFQTPVASTNALGIGVWRDGDLLHIKRHITQEGDELTLADMLRSGMLCGPRIRPALRDVIDASPDHLARIAEFMIASTQECQGWRPPVSAPSTPQHTIKPTLPLERRDLSETCDLLYWQDGWEAPRRRSDLV